MSAFPKASRRVAELGRSLAGPELAAQLPEAERGAILELLELPGDVCSREHYVPGHLTASAFVVSPDGTALLLIHHSKLMRWLQPGGHVDPEDATLLSAAVREVEEETGLCDLEPLSESPFDLDVHEIPARGDAPAHLHFDVRYAFRARDWKVQGGSDALAARWFSWAELFEAQSDESVWRAARKLQKA